MIESALSSIPIIVALLCCSAFFSGTEVAMFGLRRVDRERMARSGRRSDALILKMLSRPRRVIAPIPMGNESGNVSASAVMAATVERMFFGRSAVELALLATGLALPLGLMFGEITPKTIAFKTNVTWARAAARPIWLFGF